MGQTLRASGLSAFPMRRLLDNLLRFLSSPVVMRRANGWLVIAWLTMIPVTLASGLKNSLPFLVGISLWALVAAHWAAWQAGVVACAQDADANVQDVVDRLDANGT